MLLWGAKLDFLLQLQTDLGVTPKALAEMPELTFSQSFYYKIFTTLSYRRPRGFSGVCPIPLQDVKAYAEYYRIHDLEERALLDFYIREMDGQFLENAAKEEESPKDNS